MRRLFTAVLAGLTVLTAAACGGTPERAEIVVTTDLLGDLTRAVVGDAAPVTVLMPTGGDPHSFGVSAEQAAGLERAALVVANGLGLEEGVLRHVESAAAAGTPTLLVGPQVNPLPYRDSANPDPHFWTDPARVRTAVAAIRDRVLADVPGVDAAAVRARTDGYLTRLDELDRWMAERFAALPAERRRLVTNHHVFGYLAARFGLDVLGVVLPSGSALASPGAADLAGLATAVRAAGVTTIFADSAQPDRLARVLAEQAGVRVRVTALHTESLTPPDGGAPTYLDMMRANTAAIIAG
ncbi:zinc ABC transporter substrate-binding protein AztC [Nocardia asteroides]|uniref:zinc ABC transporter substrate-binding protein AztC n=1 Tax=Nocardia asteroides TaxID=1824 RepID=UPI001E3D5E12|nr:zinc ABC transporter substrate-binding protein AztC [Nocardia asteroides]UGT61435.1 metal ABC transporter substrate-binding protein [Nocardia asteroides]